MTTNIRKLNKVSALKSTLPQLSVRTAHKVSNPDAILSNPDGILTLPLAWLAETLVQTHLLPVPKRRLRLPCLPATSVWG